MATVDVASLADKEVVDLLLGSSPLAEARRRFASWSAEIEQERAQRIPNGFGPVEWSRMEFQAVQDIAEALGVEV